MVIAVRSGPDRVLSDYVRSALAISTHLPSVSRLPCDAIPGLPEAGLGRRLHEGLQGFARALLAGGCPCILASKWNVPVYEAVRLMMEFYGQMVADEVCDAAPCICFGEFEGKKMGP